MEKGSVIGGTRLVWSSMTREDNSVQTVQNTLHA